MAGFGHIAEVNRIPFGLLSLHLAGVGHIAEAKRIPSDLLSLRLRGLGYIAEVDRIPFGLLLLRLPGLDHSEEAKRTASALPAFPAYKERSATVFSGMATLATAPVAAAASHSSGPPG